MHLFFAKINTSMQKIDPEILNRPLWYRFLYYNACALGQRIFFYIAWTFEDLVNNASGFGFNGYDELGNPKWDLLTNVNIFKLEVNRQYFCNY